MSLRSRGRFLRLLAVSGRSRGRATEAALSQVVPAIWNEFVRFVGDSAPAFAVGLMLSSGLQWLAARLGPPRSCSHSQCLAGVGSSSRGLAAHSGLRGLVEDCSDSGKSWTRHRRRGALFFS